METCCKHTECQVSAASRVCRREYRLLFVSTVPFRYLDLAVEGHLRRFFPGKGIELCSVVAYVYQATSGWCVRGVELKIPEGVEFGPEKWESLEAACAFEGQAKPILFPVSCCKEKKKAADRCILANLVDKKGLGAEGQATSSVDAWLQQLAGRILSSMGSTCDSG